MHTARLSCSLALLVAAVTLSACGAAKKAQGVVDPVAQAAEVTQRTGTAEVTFRGEVVTNGRTAPIEGRGIIDTRDGTRARMSFRFIAQGKPVTGDEVVAGSTLYLGGDAFRGLLPSGKNWAKIDLDRLAAKSGVDTSSLDDGGVTRVREMLRYLRGAGSVRQEGREQVVGVSTTHYHAVVDLAKLAAQRGDKHFEASLRKLRTQVKGPATLDVWVDAAHRVRQEKFNYAVVTNGQSGRFVFAMQFIRFGVPMKLDTPAKDDVHDITDDVVKQLRRRSP